MRNPEIENAVAKDMLLAFLTQGQERDGLQPPALAKGISAPGLVTILSIATAQPKRVAIAILITILLYGFHHAAVLVYAHEQSAV